MKSVDTKSVDKSGTAFPRVVPKRGRPRITAPETSFATSLPGIVVRSEGQRLLLQVDATLKSIAASCGVQHTAVIDWRYGRCTPSPSARAQLYAAYEIPAPAWGQLPMGMRTDGDGVPVAAGSSVVPVEVAPVPAPVPAPVNGHGVHGVNGHGPPNSLTETSALLGQIRRQLERTDLMANDRARITDTYTKTLALQHRLQKEADLTEDRIIREHPSWQRIRLELARILARYPAVAGEVAEMLDRLGM